MTMKKYYEDKKSKFINEEELGSIFDLYDSYGFKTSLAKCRYSGGYYIRTYEIKNNVIEECTTYAVCS